MVVSTLHNFAMPLIRYRTGDYVRLAGEDAGAAAPREFLWPAVVDVVGREQEFLVSREDFVGISMK